MWLNEMYSKGHTDKQLSDNFTIQNGLKQGDALLPLLFNSVIGNTTGKAQENKVV
jgi:hypothetical protein